MSVSQVKKKFEEMSQYLNRDAEGQKRLKELKDAVNVLRTSLATAVEEKQRADAIKDQAHARADKAVAELDALLVEVQSLKATIETLRGENARLIAEMDKATSPQDREDAELFSRMRPDTPGRLLYELKKELPKCPHFRTVRRFGDRYGKIYLDDYFKTFSHQEFWAFGASAFLLTLLSTDIATLDSGLTIQLRGTIARETFGGIFKDDRHKRMFQSWFGDQCYDDTKHTEQENVEFALNRAFPNRFKQTSPVDDDGLASETLFGSDED